MNEKSYIDILILLLQCYNLVLLLHHGNFNNIDSAGWVYSLGFYSENCFSCCGERQLSATTLL